MTDERPSDDFVIAEAGKGLWVIARAFGPSNGGEAARQVAEDVRHFVLRGIHDQDSTFPFVIRSYLSLPANVLFNAILFANKKLNKRNRALNIHDRAAVSVLIAFREGPRLAVANVGVGCARMTNGLESRELVIPRSYANYLPAREATSFERDIPLVALGMGKDDFEPELVEYRLGSGDVVELGMGAEPELASTA